LKKHVERKEIEIEGFGNWKEKVEFDFTGK
jgi:hypothetical protein